MSGYAHLADSELQALGRSRCCVPGCGRTYRDEGYSELMCGKHWRLADARLRRLVTRVLIKGKRLGWPDRLLSLHERLWQKGKAQAIERAMGI